MRITDQLQLVVDAIDNEVSTLAEMGIRAFTFALPSLDDFT